MLVLIAAALAAAVPASDPKLAEAAHAIEAGRLDQARLMIADAVKAGTVGEPVERLLADLAFESGDHQSALIRYRALLLTHPDDPRMAGRAGIAAMRLGQVAEAERLLEKATSSPTASWRVWNVLGAVADHRGDWDKADAAYARAAALAPNRAEVFNNLGWSLMVRGRWEEALANLDRAAALDPKSQRIADNLELARAAIAEDLPQRRPGESESDWAARLNDAGVVARVQGDSKRAIAAFTRAIEARSRWFERAANNLAAMQAR